MTTVGADLSDRPLQHGLIGQLVADGTFAIPPLSPQALEQAIVRPAERYGATFEEGVVTAITAETSAQPAGLPLLQFALAEMYERRIDNRITASTLHQLGGLGGAIGRRAEQDPTLKNVAISPNGVVVASSSDGSLGVYDSNTLAETSPLVGARGFQSVLRFSDDGNMLLAGGDDGSLSLYDVRTRVRLGVRLRCGAPIQALS